MSSHLPALAEPMRAAFEAFPTPARARLLALRRLIFETARRTAGVGPLEEALRWGEPAYLTTQSGSGSMVRLGWKRCRPDHVALYFHCQTSLVQTFRTLFPTQFKYEGNRAILLRIGEPVDTPALALCITAALRYQLDKKQVVR